MSELDKIIKWNGQQREHDTSKVMNENEAREPDVLDPEPIYFTCTHDPKWESCRGCNEDFCELCYERHECYL